MRQVDKGVERVQKSVQVAEKEQVGWCVCDSLSPKKNSLSLVNGTTCPFVNVYNAELLQLVTGNLLVHLSGQHA